MKKKSLSSKCSAVSEDSGLGLRIVGHLNKSRGQMGRIYSKEGICPTINSVSHRANHPKILDASGPTTTINTPAKSIGKGLVQKNSSKATSETSEQTQYLSMSYLRRGFRVRVFPLQENAEVFKTKQGELFSMKSAELLAVKDLATYSLRMLKDYFHTTVAVPSRLYSFHWMSLGMMSTGKCLTLNIGCPKTASGSLSSVLEEKVDKKYYLSKKMTEYLRRNSDGRQTAQERDEAYALTDVDYKGPSMQRQNVVMVHNIYGGFKEKEPRIFTETSPTIRTPKGGGHLPGVFKDKRIRRLTPRECERLQGFPDDWTEGVSDTQRYKAMGNAVSVPVVEAIGRKILKHVD